MNADKVVELLRRLRCDHIRIRGEWVVASCPLARWTHSKTGTDSSPSFGISIDPDGESRWHCFGCNRKGLLTELLWSLRRYDEKGYDAEFAHVRFNDGMGVASLAKAKARLDAMAAPQAASETKSTGWYAAPKPLAEILQQLEPLPEEELDQFFVPITFNSVAGNYLRNDRKLKPAAWDAWGLRWQPYARRIGIPIRDHEGRLMGITGRSVNKHAKKRWLHSTGFRRDYILFGEDHFRPEHRTVVVVEGNFDTIYLWAHGYVAAGVMGSYISPYQLQQFRKFFDRAIIFRDGDEPGKAAAERWYKSLSGVMPTTHASVREGLDPDQYSGEELCDILGPPMIGPL